MPSHNKYERIFQVLEFLAKRDSGAMLSEVAAAVGMPVSSCHGVLNGMVEVDVLALNSHRKYTLGQRSRALFAVGAGSEHVVLLCRQELPGLLHEFGFDLYVARRSGDKVMYFDRGFGSQQVNVNIPLGTPLSLHATSVGKLFCAFAPDLAELLLGGQVGLRRMTDNTITDRVELRKELVRIRQQNYSVSNGEAIKGVTGISVPVLDNADVMQGALHMSALSESLDVALRERAVKSLQAAAARVAAQLG